MLEPHWQKLCQVSNSGPGSNVTVYGANLMHLLQVSFMEMGTLRVRSQGLVARELGDRGRTSLEWLKIIVNNKTSKPRMKTSYIPFIW